MTTPSDHELNEVLARVAGISVDEMTDPTGINPKPKIWVYAPVPKGLCDEWDPLHDANQNMLVRKAIVKTMGYKIEKVGGLMYAKVWNKHPQMGSQNVWEVEHKDKKRAFALSVYAMEQEKQKS